VIVVAQQTGGGDMNDLSIQDWKVFLKARIEQEQGKDDQALRVFDSLLTKYPANQHLAASRSYALQRLNRGGEAAAALIAAKYAALGRMLVGDQDRPELWTSQLHSTLADVDEFERSGRLAAAVVAW
jgi:hypothetical protein